VFCSPKPRVIYWTLGVWLALAVWISIAGGFYDASPRMIAITVWVLVAAVLVAIWSVPAVRTFAVSLDSRTLIAVHLIRFVGLAFVVLYTRGRFPFSFGVIGGVGDMVVAAGALAILAFWTRSGWVNRRPLLLVWNSFGLLDIAGVVADALREGLRNPSMMAPLRQFPLSLLPTFFVPLIIISHLLLLARIAKPLRQETSWVASHK
jgi:hypothetical protein